MRFIKMFTLSYDDGVQQDKRLIEILARYGLRGTFNINSGFFGQVHDLTRVGKAIKHNEIPADEIAAVYKSHEIATHGVTHPDLTQLNRDEIMRQIIDDRQALSGLTGYDVTGHAYPGGTYDNRVVACLRDDCGIVYARTVDAHGTFIAPTQRSSSV